MQTKTKWLYPLARKIVDWIYNLENEDTRLLIDSAITKEEKKELYKILSEKLKSWEEITNKKIYLTIAQLIDLSEINKHKNKILLKK